MRQECLKLAQQAALAICKGEDPSQPFNRINALLRNMENKPQWTAVYEAYLALHGVGNHPQDTAYARSLINTALEAYKIPVYLEQFEMLMLATVLTDYGKILCDIDYEHMFQFFNDPQAEYRFESQGIHILNEITKYACDNTCDYIAHRKLAEIYSQPMFSFIRNSELADSHNASAQCLLDASTSYLNCGNSLVA
jgi:hypothetical protein